MNGRAGAAGGPAGHGERPRAVVLIDGEHYPPVVRDTLAGLATYHDLVAALFLGGGEKLRDAGAEELDELFGLPVALVPAAAPGVERREDEGERLARLREALALVLADTGARTVIDVSDEPVLGYRERFQLISVALSWGARYWGPTSSSRPSLLNDSPASPRLRS
ncbi:MAG TPA: hypothetical protein VK576_02920 [Thermoleophilia bacterium]|nr:hypothetical protein [Thermoleophilia bacterium]